MAKITKNQARQELARRELQRREGQQVEQPQEQQGIVGKAREALQTISKGGAGVGQFVGGVGGSIAGGIPGGAIGGTLGRMFGRFNEKIEQNRDSLTGLEKTALFASPLIATPTIALSKMSATEKKELGKEFLGTAIGESVVGAATGGITTAGKGVLGALLGPRVAERGLEKGFKRLLDPKLYQDRIPRAVAKKVGGFFDKLDGVAGKAVKRSVLKKRNVSVPFKPIQQNHDDILKNLGATSVKDFNTVTTPANQIKKLAEVETMMRQVQQNRVSLPSLWKMRKKVDDIRFGFRLSDDATRYLDQVRASLNQPIKRFGGKDVTTSFSRYQLVQQQKEALEKNFKVIVGDGETFTPKVEQFANSLLGTNKDEIVRGLKHLDSFLEAEDKVVEDLLDVAAAETLTKVPELMGLFSRGAIGAVGGRRFIAGTAAQAQTPAARTINQLLIRRPLAAGASTVAQGALGLEAEQNGQQ